MEQKLRIFANYGVPTHEKTVLFTASKHILAKHSEEVEITLPEGWSACENENGSLLIILPTGERFLLYNILSTWKEKPALIWYDGRETHRIILKHTEL